MPNLSRALGGPKLLVKRDDLTDLGFGGNKARKLEYLFGDAKAKGSDVIITTGAVQSNSACMVAAAACKLGMKTVLVLQGKEPHEWDGNLLLDRLLSTDIRFIETEGRNVPQVMQRICNEMRDEGHSPYVIPVGASTPMGAIGYSHAVLELMNQSTQMRTKIDRILVACGTGGTQAGLVLGCKLYDAKFAVTGISVGPDGRALSNRVARLVYEASAITETEFHVTPDDIKILDEYVGEGYGIVDDKVLEAIRLVAKTEGILIDPVYTGKAMAALIDLIRKNAYAEDETLVFLHTGGLPALFPHKKELIGH